MTNRLLHILFGVAALLVLGLAAARPLAVTIEDEAYYLGQAHAIAHGRLVPSLADPYPGVHPGVRPYLKYPLGWPLILAAVLHVGMLWALRLNSLIVLASAAVFAALLKRRQIPPGYGFLFLLQPAILFYSQTAMADSLVVLLLLTGLLQVEKESWLVAGFFLGLAGTMRITGWIPAGIFWLWYASRTALRQIEAADLTEFTVGMLAGGVWLFVGYRFSQGSIFPKTYLAQPPFSWFSIRFFQYLVFYLTGLMLVYPMMLWGLRYLRTPERLTVAAIVIFQAGYFFVDRGRGFLDSLVLGQRLILPAVAILLLGYAGWVDELVKKKHALLPVIGLAALSAAGVVGVRFHAFQLQWSQSAAAIDRALPPGAFLQYDPRVMKLAVVQQHPGRFLGVPPENEREGPPGTYYLAANEMLTYRAPMPVDPVPLRGRKVVETPQAALYRLD